ncbi:MAG: helix-turn-helix domain-containing protein [Caldimicrobium sp.]|nr:helix-turn-helix domain-containing protein [Caldimicrobium sp.]
MLQRLEAIKDASQRKEVAFRLKVIEFHDSFGTKATVEAFGICRATIYRWKKLLKNSGGRLESLISKPRTPKRKCSKRWPQEVIEFILSYRREHPRIGKEKLKPLVDRFCRERGIALVAVSTI